MRQKKSGFFRFVFSFMPGAAEMYMGFMKNGVSLMALFLASIMIPSVLRLSDVFSFVAILIWFYSLFHAWNLSSCPIEQFQMLPDEYIWMSFMEGKSIPVSNPTLKKWGAYVLIIFGIVMLWENLSSVLYWMIPDYLWEQLSPLVDSIPQIIVAVVIIIVGIKLIQGKKEELNGEQ